MTASTSSDCPIPEHHRGLHAVAKAESDGLREEASSWQRLLSRILEAGEHNEPDRPPPRGERRECGIGSPEQIAIGLVGSEGGELVDQHHDRRALRARGVLPGLACELIRALLHRGDGILEEDDRALCVGSEACQQRATEGELHSALAVDPPDFDETAVDRLG